MIGPFPVFSRIVVTRAEAVISACARERPLYPPKADIQRGRDASALGQ